MSCPGARKCLTTHSVARCCVLIWQGARTNLYAMRAWKWKSPLARNYGCSVFKLVKEWSQDDSLSNLKLVMFPQCKLIQYLHRLLPHSMYIYILYIYIWGKVILILSSNVPAQVLVLSMKRPCHLQIRYWHPWDVVHSHVLSYRNLRWLWFWNQKDIAPVWPKPYLRLGVVVSTLATVNAIFSTFCLYQWILGKVS